MLDYQHSSLPSNMQELDLGDEEDVRKVPQEPGGASESSTSDLELSLSFDRNMAAAEDVQATASRKAQPSKPRGQSASACVQSHIPAASDDAAAALAGLKIKVEDAEQPVTTHSSRVAVRVAELPASTAALSVFSTTLASGGTSCSVSSSESLRPRPTLAPLNHRYPSDDNVFDSPTALASRNLREIMEESGSQGGKGVKAAGRIPSGVASQV